MLAASISSSTINEKSSSERNVKSNQPSLIKPPVSISRGILGSGKRQIHNLFWDVFHDWLTWLHMLLVFICIHLPSTHDEQDTHTV